MSHTMNIKIEIYDRQALELACQRLNLKMEEGKFNLYSSTEEGIGIFLPGWKYPVVIKSDGTISYDNYGGKWGKVEELNKLLAYYGLEKAKLEARKRGFSFYETFDQNSQEIILKIKI